MLEKVVAQNQHIQQAASTTIEVAEITDASIKLHLRPWTTVENYSHVATATMESIKAAFEAAGLKYSVALAPSS